MKYLKLYEYVHGVLIKASKLKKLCNDSLAYLIDDGFKVSFKREDRYNSDGITFYDFRNGTKTSINYTKDEIINDMVEDVDLYKIIIDIK